MDKESILFTLFFGWYLFNFGPPSNLLILLNFFYVNFCYIYDVINDKINGMNDYLTVFFYYSDFMLSIEMNIFDELTDNNIVNNETVNNETIDNETIDNESEQTVIKEQKYEDKYLTDIRKLNKEFEFTVDEEEEKIKKTNEIYREIICGYSTRISEIYNQFKEHEETLTKYENNDYCICNDENSQDNYLEENKEDIIENINNENIELTNELNNIKLILETEEGKYNGIKEAQEHAVQIIIKQRIEKLRNCFIIETTPLGNVLMMYDIERETFKFYSDNTIPYRYLETVGRKYVKQFNCRPIFIDMEEELKITEEKWEKDKKEDEEKKEDEKRKKEEAIKNNTSIQEKKNVFAKFKSYNKEAGTGHVNISAPPKNSIPNKSVNEKPENEKILLKERANRYTYEGKFANFNFLKKVERKNVDKKYGMTFADFKKMQQDKK